MRDRGPGRKAAVLSAVIVLFVSAACSSAPTASSGKVTIDLWHNYGIESNATATQNLVKDFEAKNPNITINVVSQPAQNYFDLLQAAAISKTGPCLATQWTGLYALKYKSYLEKLNPTYMSTDTLKKFKGVEFASENFDPDQGVYVVPLEMQFFNGFYNKELFAKAGITSLPTDWSELFDASRKLKAAGILPFVYGTGGQAQQSGFNPIYDLSYLMMNFPLTDWKKLYTGELQWTDPRIVAQLDKWVTLKTDGYTNPDVLTNTESWQQFLAGKAAMTIEGTWGISEAEKALGDKLGVFLPPFVDQPLKGVVEMAGDGFSMTTYCPQKDAAASFLTYMVTPDAQKIIEDSGLIPGEIGFTSNNALAVDLMGYAADKGYTRYPMIDGVLQTEVVDTFVKVLNAAFAGTMSTTEALTQMQNTLMALPADRRSSTYQ